MMMKMKENGLSTCQEELMFLYYCFPHSRINNHQSHLERIPSLPSPQISITTISRILGLPSIILTSAICLQVQTLL